MSEYARYPEYKDSGVPWLGDIPSHWQAPPLKYYFDVQLGKMLQPKSITDEDFEIFYLKAQHVQWDYVKTTDLPMMWANSSDIQKYSVENGDLLICEGGEVGRCFILKNLEDKAIIQNALHRVRASNQTVIEFLNYVIQHTANVNWFSILCNKATIAHLTSEKLINLYIPLPPKSEQAQIANFLDHELGKIDALIDKQQLLLDKLAEQRSAVITQAVTKGLNPNADMKDSGVAWLGNTPYNWEVKKIRYLIDKIYTGSTPPTANSEYYDEGDWNWFNPADFKKSLFLSDSKKKLNSLAITENKVDLIPKNSVLIIGIGATLGKVALAEVDCSTNQQINSLIINKANSPKFITYALSVQREIMSLISNSATLAIMNQEKTKSIILAVPPLAEQNNIVKHLDQETQKIDQMTETVNRTIERLKEYRSTLITQAVTGKIKVF